MEDIQGLTDERGIALDRVGVSGLRYPIVVLDREHERQRTVATISMCVSLPHHFKGTHMSRFVEIMNRHCGEVTMRTLPQILRELQQRLEAETAEVEVAFPYFLERAAPVSGARGIMDYDCAFIGRVKNSLDDFVLRIRVPVTSLCPCSKAISEYGAHNQRGYITVEVRPATTGTNGIELIWIEELIEVCEESASCAVYPLLKREDERHVTMKAYENPRFVEDMVRNVAVNLREDSRVRWFRVHAENMESIHNHAAFAELEWQRQDA